MNSLAARIFQQYERGELSRRQAVAGLMGLGAAMAGAPSGGHAAEHAAQQATFQATGLDHIALSVTDVSRSRDFYIEHLGLCVRREQEGQRCFLGPEEGEFLLALFRAEQAQLNHYCYAIESYQADEVVAKLERVGIEPRRESNRVYFPDPDGLAVQLAARADQ